MTVLITIPHGKPEATGHLHDQGAIEMLPLLSAALRTQDIEFDVIVGKNNRSLIDLNRNEAKNTDFIKEFREALKNTTVHIDLHSYPYLEEHATNEEAITKQGYDLREWGLSDVVVFDIEEVTNQELMGALIESIEGCCQIDQIEGGYENYLTIVASSLFDVPSILVELNESSRRQYSQIAEAVADSLVAFVS
jgi:hypothetical protein